MNKITIEELLAQKRFVQKCNPDNPNFVSGFWSGMCWLEQKLNESKPYVAEVVICGKDVNKQEYSTTGFKPCDHIGRFISPLDEIGFICAKCGQWINHLNV